MLWRKRRESRGSRLSPLHATRSPLMFAQGSSVLIERTLSYGLLPRCVAASLYCRVSLSRHDPLEPSLLIPLYGHTILDSTPYARGMATT